MTPPSARIMDVIYDEVKVENNKFVITDSSEEEGEENSDLNKTSNTTEEQEDQFMFTFDFPIQEKAQMREEKKAPIQNKQQSHETNNKQETSSGNKVVHNLNERTKDMEVNEPVEIIPVTESSVTGIKRYSLDDYMEVEQMLKNPNLCLKTGGG